MKTQHCQIFEGNVGPSYQRMPTTYTHKCPVAKAGDLAKLVRHYHSQGRREDYASGEGDM